jgi:Domain of unknown function (DUF397)
MSDPSSPVWHRSSYCSNATCVEVAHLGSQILVRDSKAQDRPILSFQQAEWEDFLEGARRGEFNFSIQQPQNDPPHR